jgi:hypothetical protein
MLSLPPIVLLLPCVIFALGYVFFAFANVISLGKYGARNFVGLLASFCFISGTAIIVFLTWQSLATVDWFSPVPLAAIPTPSF